MSLHASQEPFRKQRSLESLKRDFRDEVLNKTNGLYFMRNTLMKDKETDTKLLEILCPRREQATVKNAFSHVTRLLSECCNSFDLLGKFSKEMYWEIVASDTSAKCGIDLPEDMARELVFSLLKALQRWNIHQGLQRLHKHFENKNPDSPSCAKSDWQLTEEEKTAVRNGSVQMGPARKVSNKKFELSPHGAQKLYLITELPGDRFCKPDLMGLIDKRVMDKPAPKFKLSAASQARRNSVSSFGSSPPPPDISSGGLFSPSRKLKKTKTDDGWLGSLPSSGIGSERASSPIGSIMTGDSPCPSTGIKRRNEFDDVDHSSKKQVAEDHTARNISPTPTKKQVRRRRHKSSMFIQYRR
ncbi:hypothetical protein PT974_12314 [Cladobotryum mycophilum]|uniref:Uncharacterized protein n=1 Tax=Cladobotryum mycophilum TaxID=491253 RepID=A0ABR0S866_9HYPO